NPGLNSPAPAPPLVEQYNDVLTGRELLALPDQFLFDSVRKWQTLAETYMAFGNFSKADACFRRAAAADPRSPELALHPGYCLVRLGRLVEAPEAFRLRGTGDDWRPGLRASDERRETH